MDCEQALEYISAALDGELSEQEQAALDEHLAQCARCRALAAELGALSAGVAALEADPPPGLAARVMAAVAQEPPPEEQREPETEKTRRARVIPFPAPERPRTWKFPRSAVAVLAVAVCLGGVFLWSGHIGTDGSGGQAAPADLAPAAPAAMEPQPSSAPEAADGGLDGPASDSYGAAEGEDSVDRSSDTVFGDVTADKSGEPDGYLEGTPEEPVPEPDRPQPMTTNSADVPQPAPAPGGTVGNTQLAGNGTADGALPSENGGEPEVSQDQALELVFAHLGGYAVYPDAAIEEECGYVLAEVEGSGGQGKRRLAFEAVSANGACYIFRLYDSFWHDSGGGERTVTVGRYAVSMTSGHVLEASESGYAEMVGG